MKLTDQVTGNKGEKKGNKNAILYSWPLNVHQPPVIIYRCGDSACAADGSGWRSSGGWGGQGE